MKVVNAGLAARNLPGAAQPVFGGGLGRGESRVILHVDMDCFFVSVLVKNRPELRDKPVAVAHNGTAKWTAVAFWIFDSSSLFCVTICAGLSLVCPADTPLLPARAFLFTFGVSEQRQGGGKQRNFVVQLPRQGEGLAGWHVHDAGQEAVPGADRAQVRAKADLPCGPCGVVASCRGTLSGTLVSLV